MDAYMQFVVYLRQQYCIWIAAGDNLGLANEIIYLYLAMHSGASKTDIWDHQIPKWRQQLFKYGI
jgi:hypothetical protein